MSIAMATATATLKILTQSQAQTQTWERISKDELNHDEDDGYDYDTTTRTSGRSICHFVYASSSEIYNVDDQNRGSNNGSDKHSDGTSSSSFSEEWNITTLGTKYGASKLIDEILAQSYYNMYGIYSVGLRFFDVYGPWSSPGSALFEMASED